MAAGLLFDLHAVFEDGEAEVGLACFLGVDSSHHLGVVVEGLLGLEGSLSRTSGTWLPVMPWQMTLVFLLTQTLAPVEKKLLHTLLSIKYLYCRSIIK